MSEGLAPKVVDMGVQRASTAGTTTKAPTTRSTLRRVVIGLVAASLLATACGGDDDGGAPADTSTAPPAVETSTSEGSTRAETASPPAPPEVPRDFTWTGRYQVPDLDLEVPFTWHGADGDFQMIAGGEDHPIHFTNLIHDGTLYTLTYEWPEIPRMPCSNVGPFTLEDLNAGLADAAFVGRETLHDVDSVEVNHFRSTGVLEVAPEDLGISDVPVIRIPLMSGDIYVEAEDSTVFRKVLQFGVQNLYDAQLDEWMVIDTATTEPGRVVLPDECDDAAPPQG